MARGRKYSQALPERVSAPPVEMMDEDQFHRRFPAAAFVPAVEKRANKKALLFPGVVAGAGMALIVLALLVMPSGKVDKVPDTQYTGDHIKAFGTHGPIRTKGIDRPYLVKDDKSPQMRIEVLRNGYFIPVGPGETLHAADLLRFFYSTTSQEYLYVFSVDRHGQISTYYPDQDGASIPIVAGRNIPLPQGVRLDDYRGTERFFALFSHKPLQDWQVEAAVDYEMKKLKAQQKGLESLNRLELPARQVTIWVDKR